MNLPIADKIIVMGKVFQFNEQEMIYLVFNMSVIKLAICRRQENIEISHDYVLADLDIQVKYSRSFNRSTVRSDEGIYRLKRD